jgi:hypothetical protein
LNEQVCGMCHHQNKIDTLDHVKVFFVWASDIFYFPVTHFQCPKQADFPSMQQVVFKGLTIPTTTGSGFSYLFGTGDERSQPALEKGRYRIHCSFSGVDCCLDVQRDATEDDEPLRRLIRVSEIRRAEIGMQKKVVKIEHGKIRLDLLA